MPMLPRPACGVPRTMSFVPMPSISMFFIPVRYAAVIVLWLRTAWRLWHAGAEPLWIRQEGLFFLVLMAFYLPNAMFHNPNLTPGLNMLLFFLAGVLEGLRAHGDPRKVAERPQDASAARSALLWRPVN